MPNAIVILDELNESELIKDVCIRAKYMYDYFGTKSKFIFLKTAWVSSIEIKTLYDIDNKEYIEKYIIDKETSDIFEIRTYIQNIISSEDSVFFDKRIITINNKSVLLDDISLGLHSLEKIAVLHECHLDSDSNYSFIDKNYIGFLRNSKNFTKFAVFTQEQKNDLLNITNIDSTQIIVITPTTTLIPISNSGPNICLVSDLTTDKCVDKAIMAMQLITQKLPDIKLDIYGTGALLPALQELVGNLNLSKSINFMGYKSNMSYVYSLYSVCISTSNNESLNRNVIESLSSGTPVIAINCKYGHSNSIIDNVNGNIVKTYSDLAEKVILLLETRSLMITYKRNTVKISNSYNDAEYKKSLSLLC